MIFLTPQLKPLFPDASFKKIMELKGEVFRALEGRRTQRIQYGDDVFFVKHHFGVGWKEIIKNVFQLRLPVISAKNEWSALERLKELKVNAPEILGYGACGWNPASRQSFIITRSLQNTQSLEDICALWQNIPPPFSLKYNLIRKMAEMVQILHENGINHRDLYLCHFLLDMASIEETSHLKLYLIDLHRAQLRKKIPMRWRIKDLAGLYFSSKKIGLTKRDILRFIKKYRNNSLRNVLNQEMHFWQKVKKRGDTLYRKYEQ
ncbi:MAG: lipopolysaccharide core heptose(I) kinase RfaP [Gammaproteobacteria bacterium]|nr:lipopolysaccharide core heptose(I) kinase RfaP [Gammaproteobacteria bacterium]